MSNKNRLVMDVDYYDLAYHGYGREELKGVLDRCAKAGVQTIVMSVIFGGYAQYHSKILPLYDGKDRRIGSKQAAAIYKTFDPLAAVVELGKERGIDVLAYYRMYDHYWPGLCDKNIDNMEHGWWESRCGRFQFKGWPCYAEPQVMEYSLNLVSEIASYGVGFMFGLTRSHSLYCSPYRQPHFFGFNQPIADEYARRYGVDIRAFDYCEDHMSHEGYLGNTPWPFLNEVEYVGASEFDLVKWHWLKGEEAATFLRNVRKILGDETHIAIEASPYACPPVADPADTIPAKLYVDPVALAKDGTINEWMVQGNFRNTDFQSQILPAFQGVREAGAEINLWLNDVLASDGGSGGAASIPQIEQYLQTATASDFSSFTFHEADFIEQHPEAKQVWRILGERFGKS